MQGRGHEPDYGAIIHPNQIKQCLGKGWEHPLRGTGTPDGTYENALCALLYDA